MVKLPLKSNKLNLCGYCASGLKRFNYIEERFTLNENLNHQHIYKYVFKTRYANKFKTTTPYVYLYTKINYV